MNSFDVFDTLLARRFVTATPLFNQIETETKIPDFVARRTAADNGARSLAEIYTAAGLPTAVMERELQLEYENAIPIKRNLQLVAHGDLLISDMYMSAEDILRMVRGIGLDRQVTIFQSNKGKSSGEVWRRLLGVKPDRHLGDNAHSDYNLPKSMGFICELYHAAKLTRSEVTVMEAGLPLLACLMREIRLGATAAQYTEFFRIACQLNLPWLFVTCELLRRRHSEKLTFLGRDCQLLSRIFNAYFGPCYYLPFSRRVVYAQPAQAVAFLQANMPQDGLLIDLSSTGASWEKLGPGIRVEAIVYSDVNYYTPERPRLPAGFSFLTRNSECGQTNELIEIFNCGDHGYLESIEALGEGLMAAKFGPLQLDPGLIESIHAPLRAAEVLAPIYRDRLAAELGRVPAAHLSALFAAFAQELCVQEHLMPHLVEYLEREAEYKTLLNARAQPASQRELATA
jgi:hypothetical protein